MLRANVIDRRISRQLPFRIPQGTVGEKIELNLDAEWLALDKVVLIWTGTGTGSSVETLLEGTVSVVPWEVLEHTGNLYLSLVGYVMGSDGEMEQRITTAKMVSPWTIEVCGDLAGAHAAPATPDLAATVLSAIARAEKVATELRQEADSGAFTGPAGPQGAPGAQGKTGKDGAAGESFFPGVQAAGYTGTKEEFLAELVALVNAERENVSNLDTAVPEG